MRGRARIEAVFQAAKNEARAALMPYFTLGYPDPQRSLEIVTALAGAGADLLELGIPFSDPLADGPTIQASTQAALQAGISVGGCLELTAALRSRGVSQPLLLMGYANPLLAYGVARFVADAAQAGADGFIIPDLPLEEADELAQASRAQDLALIPMLAPTSTPQRVMAATAEAAGFIYLVSLSGVTGARQALPPGLKEFVARVRAQTRTPLAVGFGVSSPAQARQVGEIADGVIVGSALIDAVRRANGDPAAGAAFVASLRAALGPAQET